MKALLIFLILAACVVLEAAFFPYLPFSGAAPSLTLIAAALAGFFRGRTWGALVGLAGGLLEDAVTGRALGLSGLSKMIVGYIIGSIEEKVFKGNPIVPLVFVFVGALVDGVIYFGVGSSFGLLGDFMASLRHIIIPRAVVDVIIAGVLYRLACRLNQYLGQERLPKYRSI
ncbi:MAG: rod shape-determining protein MreD [Firmicutes bacterium]|nr:rod shape-determining protein MreD [Bacillota bacterium]